MTALIEELLDLTRLETIGNLSLNRDQTDLVQVAKGVLRAYENSAPDHELALDTRLESLTGRWDEARLERAISNLVGNAVKYSPEGRRVMVGISRESVAGEDRAVVSVSDQGIGIAPDDLERIFDRFQRGSNVPDSLAGSGVGLAYVREIVLQHGGTISVHSRPGEGSTFTIRLPLEAR
jgi:signal transduction histidine kinase